ncbi:DNA ligase 2 [Cellulomonas hominis]|uniref:DNA ligase n=1 Tax=Cellulomonas hominis TaxID=156981 RepID=A0A511FBG3_9CELL|nr:NAD-dependent DNA ligase LigA [Cellulomonas hominis]MBB5474563.1 DNA ligase (NAD+) [Cellulomonas hominis]NKY05599.1 NAD-dependent DNA ligase LigA [Cellulomonas hominis]GEL46601.1 DNA ligase 2 [Cellulomonas hominis]
MTTTDAAAIAADFAQLNPLAEREAYLALGESLRAAAKSYYDGTEQLMSDAEYDAGIAAIEARVALSPTEIDDYEDLLTSIAAGQSKGGDVTHPSRMGSLEKADGREGLRTFVTSVAGPLAIEPKLDGLAIRAQYDAEGRLVLVATRGNGTTGEDITRSGLSLRIQGLPRRIDPTYGVREVRGEVYCADTDFLRAQTVRASLEGAPFVNSRNAAAGILRKGDKAYAGILSFAAYGTGLTRPPASGRYTDAMRVAAEAGVATTAGLLDFLHPVASGTRELDDVLAQVDALDERRETIGFPIDGIVIKADAAADRKSLGEGDRAPKWALAYKYAAETATTKVVAIETAIGRTGRLAIRVEVEPVFVGGTTITFATGHNVSWMTERDVRVGDTVTIKRANDVIPYIESVDLGARPTDSAPWAPPETDPLGEPWDKSTLLWRSVSPELSVLGRITYAASRDCLDIEGLGTEIATALVESGKVNDVADLFALTVDDLAALTLAEGRQVGQKVAAKIAAEIETAKASPWNRVITALGIRMTGRTAGRRLAAAFATMDALRGAGVADIAAVDGFGDVKAATIREGLDDLAARGVLDRLAAAGVNMGAERAQGEAAGPLAGMTVVVSGSVPGYSRTTVAEAIEAAGGKASSSVSAGTSMLVSDPSTSSKYVKATQLGVRILTPAQFLDLLGGGSGA